MQCHDTSVISVLRVNSLYLSLNSPYSHQGNEDEYGTAPEYFKKGLDIRERKAREERNKDKAFRGSSRYLSQTFSYIPIECKILAHHPYPILL